MSDKPKYPDIEVELTSHDGNAGAIMGSVARALKKAGVEDPEINKFRAECMSGSYDNLLRTCMKWVEVS